MTPNRTSRGPAADTDSPRLWRRPAAHTNVVHAIGRELPRRYAAIVNEPLPGELLVLLSRLARKTDLTGGEDPSAA